jgi:hypothetical protein
MKTLMLLPKLPAALAYCRSQIGGDGARCYAQTNQDSEPATAMPVEHCNRHHMLVRAGSHVIGRAKAQHGQHRATSASTNSP